MLLLLLLWRYSYAACGKQTERQTDERRMQHTNYAAVKCGPRFRLQLQLLHQLWLLLRRLVCGELPRLPPPRGILPATSPRSSPYSIGGRRRHNIYLELLFNAFAVGRKSRGEGEVEGDEELEECEGGIVGG